jgi:hypothetical protein
VSCFAQVRAGDEFRFIHVSDFSMSDLPAAIPEVYILWHPNFDLGGTFAEKVTAWLRPGNGLGPEVFYRSLPAPGAAAGELPLPLPRRKSDETKGARLQIVLALIDENMVSDFSWRHWLDLLAKSTSSENRVVWPVSLDATAYNMPASIKELNYFRPTGLPLPADGKERESRLELVTRSLLKQVTEAMCRVVLPRTGSPVSGPSGSIDPLPKVSVFLSHAKIDGTTPARQIRDYIYGQTQLAAFYDENDIAFGAGFANTIQQNLESSSTAALIAIRSARYASRPWCRRELSLFRRPQQEKPVPEEQQNQGPEYWRLHPSLVVEAMEGSEFSMGIPELGNTPAIRWNDGDKGLAELIVTTVIRDAMLSSFHSALGKNITTRKEKHQIVINWLPDAMTLLHIPKVRSADQCDIFYPGRGLSGLELMILKDMFPRLTFWSFEEALP